MPHEAQRAVEELGADDRGHLVGLAALVADERTAPADLVRAALLAVAERRTAAPGADDPAAAVREELVRRALRRTPRPRSGPAGGRPAEPADPADDGIEALGRALARLPARTRAAVALSAWAGLPGASVAAALRLPVETVRAEVTLGSAALQPSTPAGRTLPQALDDLARARTASAAAAGADPGWSGLRPQLERRRRRRWTTAAAACAVVVVAVAALWGGVGSRTEPAAAGPTARAERVDLATLPTRGSLADDEAFLEGLRGLPWAGAALAGYPAPVETVPGTRRVLFAGDVPGGRWALVVGRPELVVSPDQPPGPAPLVLPGDHYMAWFTGPPGAEAEEMTLASYPYGLAPEVVPALLDPRTGTLVVVTAPGDSVEVSPGVQIDTDGEDSRRWAGVETSDGVAVAQVPPVGVPWNWSVAFRVLRDGRATLTSSPTGVLVPLDQPIPRLDVDLPGPAPEEARLAADLAGLAVLSATGVPAEDVRLTAHAVVAVPPPAQGALALVTATLPSGAVVVSAQWALDPPDRSPSGATCGLEVRPAGSAPEDSLVVARCEVFEPGSGDPVRALLLVVAPRDVAMVRVYRGDSTFIAEHAVPDGGPVVVPAPAGSIRIEAVTEGGVLLGRTEPLGQWLPSD